MHLTRPAGRVAILLKLQTGLIFLALSFHTAVAQSAPPPPPPPPAAPAATPEPTTTRPAVPAQVTTPQSTVPTGAAPSAVRVDASQYPASPPYLPVVELPHYDNLSSAYIPVDSPVYEMALRLYSLGYIDTAFINMRPWTRRSLLHMLQKSTPAIMSGGDNQAIDILAKLDDYLAAEDPGAPSEPLRYRPRGMVYGVQSVYTRILGIDGQSLRDSFHLGQTIANDYGRPYAPGVNNITGFSTLNEYGRFSLFVRGEYEHAPSTPGYSLGLATALSNLDQITPFAPPNDPQSTIPYGNTGAQNPFRLQEATLSYHLLGHEFSAGKSDAWLGPSLGGAMDWSNNAEDIYSFRINRVEPMYIPWVDKVLGPLRYDFFVGSLKGHTDPNSPWVHSEMFSFAPSSNFQFAFQRTVIWGGEGHVPITFDTFFRSFFSIHDTENDPLAKNSRNDPGARFSDFNFSYRLPFVRKYLTLTLDSECHDDVSPISAPRRAGYRPGIYLSQIPGIPKLDFRVEAANTDVSTTISYLGQAEYYETVQRQGYTNKGFIMGDWIGRQAKGGEAWLTYHLSGNEWIQAHYLDKKIPVGFIAGGTSQSQFKVDAVKRFHKDIELDAWVQYEKWKAPIYVPSNNATNDTAIAVQLTWFPKLHTETLPSGK
jgi:hypothetical protein